MTVLVIADKEGNALNPATAKAVAAAKGLGGDVHVLVLGNAPEAAKQAADLQGVAKVIHATSPHFAEALAENVAPFVAGLAKDYAAIVQAATTTGKDVLPRVAALLDVAMLSDVIRIESPTQFVRPIYAGNILATVESNEPVKVLTVRVTAFDAVDKGGNAAIEDVADGADAGLSRFVSKTQTESSRPDLTAARVVVSGGRGLGSKDNFTLLDSIADKLNAAIGASRAAVDAGYVPNDYQVGQTGKVVAPELYIAVGISGAIQHLAGMKDSKVIVAINKDENAPIFEIADYGLVGDLFTILPELEKQL